MRPATRLLLVTTLIAGCQTPCGPLWGMSFLAPAANGPTVPAGTVSTSPGAVTPVSGGVASASPRPTATTTATPTPVATATATAAPTPTATATPAGTDVSTAILGTWTYNDLQSSATLVFETGGSVRTTISNDPGTIGMYRRERYTVDGTLVQLSITDAPGFEGGSADVSISADGQRMTTKGGKVYKRK